MAATPLTLNSLLNTHSGSGIGIGAPAGGLAPGSSVGQSQQRYAYDDQVAAPVAASTGANVQQSQQSLQNLLNDPTSAQGYQNILAGLRADAQPGIQQGYQDLQDQFREAGALQSGNYGNALSKYASGVQRNDVGMAGEALKAFLPTLVSGYSSMATQGPSLLDALKQTDQFNYSAGQGQAGGIGMSNKSAPPSLHTPVGTSGDLMGAAGQGGAVWY